MDLNKFKSLIKYYLSCIDAEEAASLQLRKNQEYQSYIFVNADFDERLFAEDAPQIQLSISNAKEEAFLKKKAVDGENIVNLYYGYPVFKDSKDMLSPLFHIEVETNITTDNKLKIIPQIKSFSVNRLHFINQYGIEETQRICEELEGEFGSFEARLKLAETYIASLKSGKADEWIFKPILFRTNNSGSRGGLRYDLTYLLKNDDVLKEETALKYFLMGCERGCESNQKAPPILEIASLNPQQEEAVSKGLMAPLSVVTGPPGTGKTQVVTTLLASSVYNNQSVLFASNNNMPVDGVYERLGQSAGKIGNWLMRLGNLNKRQICQQTISSLCERLEREPRIDLEMQQDEEKFEQLEAKISRAKASLAKAIELQKRISECHLREKAVLHSLPKNWDDQFSKDDPIPLSAISLKQYKSHSKQGLWLWLKLKIFGFEKWMSKHDKLLHKILDQDQNLPGETAVPPLESAPNEFINQAQQKAIHYELHHKWGLYIANRRRYEEQLTKLASVKVIDKLKAEKTTLSQMLLEKHWLSQIQGHAMDALLSLKNYFQNIDDYSSGRHKRLDKSIKSLKRYFPIWITTNQSASSIMPPQAALFDLVVIDEAGQCDIPSIIPLLYRAKRAVLIGDPHQFKHITTLSDALEHKIAHVSKVEDITDEWSFTKRSAFDRAYQAAQETTFLKQHYRCHPDIIEFSNISFYNGKLVKQAAISKFQNTLPIQEQGLVWQHVDGKVSKAAQGAWNEDEVDAALKVFDKWAQQGLFVNSDLTYGVVTPFRKQSEQMYRAISQMPWFESVRARFTIGTAHSFQGSECDVLIYSPVVAEGMQDYLVKFAASQEDLINVSVTRAKNLLYIVGDINACQAAPSDTPLHQLALYADNLRQRQAKRLNSAERALANLLTELGLSYEAQFELGQYRLDFLLNAPSGEIYNIEVDGDIHLTAEAIQHDERRDAFVQNTGMNIIRFTARDVVNRPELIKKRLMYI
jgi:very-short-patch-repair endonuclease